MSVRLESLDGEIEENVANGTWMKCVQLGRAYFGDEVHKWDGCHDGDEWSGEACGRMHDALEMASKGEFNAHVDKFDRQNLMSDEWKPWIANAMGCMNEILEDLSLHGGVRIS